MPFAVAASSVPILAFAPLFNNWFGLDQQLSKAMVAAALCFFPVMINTVRGLTTVDPRSLELLRSYATPERDVFRKLRVPNALPYIFTALRLAVTLATIGAVVGEYFAAPRASLGQYIATYSAFLNFERSWAAIVFACAIGIGLYLVVVVLERLVMPWHDRRAGRSDAEASIKGSDSLGHRSLDCARRRRTALRSVARRGIHMRTRRIIALFAALVVVAAVRVAVPPRSPRQPGRTECLGRDQRSAQRSRRADAHPAPAPVVPAGPVRRLLRGDGQGLLREEGLRRHDPAGRRRDRARDGRRRRPGRVRHQLGAAHARPARSRRRRRRHRPGLPALADTAGLVQGQEHHQARGPQGQEGRRVGLRQRGRAVRRPAQGRARPGQPGRRRRSSRSSSTWRPSRPATSMPPRR